MVRRRSWAVVVAVAGLGTVSVIAAGAGADAPPISGAAVATAEASPVAATCPGWSAPEATGSTPSGLPELSGLAPALDAGQWWTHNDSGDSARVFLVERNLAVVAEVGLDVAFAFDIEDIATGPDGRVWVADIGDNLRIRPGIVLWGIPQSARGTVTPTVVNLTYPDGARDAETLMIDPITGDGFVVAKALVNGRASVYRVAAAAFAAPSGSSSVLEFVGSIDVSDGGAVGPTAGAISPSGGSIVIKTFTTTYLWPRRRGDSVGQTLTATPVAPCRVPGAGTNEAIAFSFDGRRLATVAEGVGVPLLTLTRTS